MTSYLQVSATLDVYVFCEVTSVAINVTGPEVAAVQTVVPLVSSCALLIEISSGSGLVHVGYTRTLKVGAAQPVPVTVGVS